MNVIVGVDDSDFSNRAIRFVAESKWPEGSRFVVISAAGWPAVSGPGELLSASVIEEVQEEQERQHQRIADKAAAQLKEAGLTAEARAMSGDPRFTLVDEAEKERADLVVVGTHGRTGVKRLLLGSVASFVVAHAPCSVLVVRTAH
jgi:nucleotide-binding universal stress UspA family protein